MVVDVDEIVPASAPEAAAEPPADAKPKAAASKKNKKGDGNKADDEDDEKVPQVSFLRLFRFVTKSEAAMLVLAFLGACIQGAGWPVVSMDGGRDRRSPSQ